MDRLILYGDQRINPYSLLFIPACGIARHLNLNGDLGEDAEATAGHKNKSIVVEVLAARRTATETAMGTRGGGRGSGGVRKAQKNRN